MRCTLTLAAATALLVVAPARAQTQAPTQTRARTQVGTQFQGQAPGGTQGQGTATRMAVNDALFAAAAADGGLTELSLSQLGLQKATDPELKRFSQQMIDEHTRMNAELTTLAAQKGIARAKSWESTNRRRRWRGSLVRLLVSLCSSWSRPTCCPTLWVLCCWCWCLG